MKGNNWLKSLFALQQHKIAHQSCLSHKRQVCVLESAVCFTRLHSRFSTMYKREMLHHIPLKHRCVWSHTQSTSVFSSALAPTVPSYLAYGSVFVDANSCMHLLPPFALILCRLCSPHQSTMPEGLIFSATFKQLALC